MYQTSIFQFHRLRLFALLVKRGCKYLMSKRLKHVLIALKQSLDLVQPKAKEWLWYAANHKAECQATLLSQAKAWNACEINFCVELVFRLPMRRPHQSFDKPCQVLIFLQVEFSDELSKHLSGNLKAVYFGGSGKGFEMTAQKVAVTQRHSNFKPSKILPYMLYIVLYKTTKLLIWNCSLCRAFLQAVVFDSNMRCFRFQF